MIYLTEIIASSTWIETIAGSNDNPKTSLELLEQAKRSEAAAAIQTPVTSIATTRTVTEEVSEEMAAIHPHLTHRRQSYLHGSQQPNYFSYNTRGRIRQQQQERWPRSQPSTRWFGPSYRQKHPDYYSSSTECYSCGKPGHFARECRSSRANYYPKA
ncbi:unnamed protein product [Didymodactylos carnosus]|uniref:CCHC-type domain-containing protein n=1 Tax=Didymodactylos carnosus TaxID=1234261 RepID=A0A814NLB6_9BILA|nr:unnamed protein product [Didymodactylos carnosus]CAF3859988.1 unnamed protein product [Didymodactylos carnosus]